MSVNLNPSIWENIRYISNSSGYFNADTGEVIAAKITLPFNGFDFAALAPLITLSILTGVFYGFKLIGFLERHVDVKAHWEKQKREFYK